MESTKIVVMNLFEGQEKRLRHREQTYGHRKGKERVGQIERVALKHIHYHCCMMQGVQTWCSVAT